VMCIEAGGKNVFAATTNGEIQVFTTNFKHLETLKVEAAVGHMLFIKPYLWVGTEKEIIILDTTNFFRVRTAHGHKGMVHSMAQVGNHVWSCGSDKTIRVWSLTGEAVKVIEGHSGKVFGVCQVGDNHVWSCSWDKSIIIWNKDNYAFLRELRNAHTDAVSFILPIEEKGEVQFVWTSSWDASITTWRYATPQRSTITEGQTIIRQGFLFKQGGEIKTWKYRWFVLNSHGLLTYYPNQNASEPLNTIDVRGCPAREELPMANLSGSKRFVFSVETREPRKAIEKRTYLMACENREDMDKWLAALQTFELGGLPLSRSSSFLGSPPTL